MAQIDLTWTASSPAPAFGYRIKYWPTGYPAQVVTVVPNPTGTSYSITGLASGTSYSGTIEASCAGGAYSTPIAWSVTASGGSGGGGNGGGDVNYTFWDMREVDCYTGDILNYNVTVAFVAPFTPLSHKYYKPTGGGSSVYYNFATNEAPSTTAPILGNIAFTTYLDACNANLPNEV